MVKTTMMQYDVERKTGGGPCSVEGVGAPCVQLNLRVLCEGGGGGGKEGARPNSPKGVGVIIFSVEFWSVSLFAPRGGRLRNFSLFKVPPLDHRS